MKRLRVLALAASCGLVVGGVAVYSIAGAASTPSSFVSITPCRLLDTRPGTTVGEHPGPLGAGETATLAAVGTHGNCTIPTGANGIVTNVTITKPTAASFLTLFPSDAPLPTVGSNINWVANQPPIANQVTVGLSPAGSFNVFNSFGTVEVIIDIVGYYQAVSPTPTAGNWGVIDRDTIGSPVAQLRSGPTLGPSAPPFGTGSLNLSVGSADEKVAYGNDVDFFGKDFDSLTAVGFYVFNVAENLGGSNPMPSIAIEVNPHLENFPTDVFSTLVYVPPVTAPGWSKFIDATTTGLWGGTGAAFAGTPCDLNGSRCTWTQLKAMLDDGGDPATIFSIEITKGRDQAWQGAVDGLTINDTVYNFEENGVIAQPAS